jgi:hypothetical protein
MDALMYVVVRTIIISLLLLVGTSAVAQSDERAVILEHYKWFGETPKAKLIRVINPFGSITTRNTTYDNIEVSGVIQRIGDNPGLHKIDIRDNKGVTEIVVSYPKGNKNNKGQLTGRFDLGIWVPAWVTVDMATDFGDIKVKKHASNIIAKTQSGKISIGASGLVNASSVSGNISADLYGERFSHAMSIASQTGDVKVKISQKASVIIHAHSATPVKSNISDYQAIKLARFGDNELIAQLAADNKPSSKLQIAAEQGLLFIYIAKKPSYRIKSVPRLLSRKRGDPNKSKTIKATTVQGASVTAAPTAQ